MTTSDLKRGSGFSLRLAHVVILILAVLVTGLLIFMTYQSSTVFIRLNKATGNYIIRQKAAHDLMEASDYLTEMVQRFTLEGDTQYLNNYFEEAFVSRRREVSIMTMSENEAEQSILEQIQNALNESNSLMYREYYAMKLVIDAKEYREFPDTLRGVELKTEDIMLTAEEKMELAQTMVMGSEYYNRKEIIRTEMKRSLEMLDKLMSDTRQATSAQMTRELNLVRIAVIVIAVAILFMIALNAYLTTIPLLKAETCLEKGEKFPVQGAREVRNLLRAYNQLADGQSGPEREAGIRD